MINIKNLHKSYALHGINLDIEPGELFAYIGPNGAGKSTTIKILLGLTNPDEGSVELVEKKYIGYLPENPYFYTHLTATEVLQFYAKIFNIKNPDIKSILERVDLLHAKDKRLGDFSKGMLQRVGIAQALINNPRLLILDEPMSGLDPLGRKKIKEIILQEKKKGTTIFLSSHILSDVQDLADRVAIINLGRLKYEGLPGEDLEKLFISKIKE
jgi:ABC-2 type transport system ATP-binding protein